MATSGLGPASARASARATGSLSIRTMPTSSPASFSRTISERRACRSMATYCFSTGPLFRDRDGLSTPSFPLGPVPAREDSTFLFDVVRAATATSSERLQGRYFRDPSARARQPLCHAITSRRARDCGTLGAWTCLRPTLIGFGTRRMVTRSARRDSKCGTSQTITARGDTDRHQRPRAAPHAIAGGSKLLSFCRPVGDDLENAGWRADQFVIALIVVVGTMSLLGAFVIYLARLGGNVYGQVTLAVLPAVPALIIGDRVRHSEWSKPQKLLIQALMIAIVFAVGVTVLRTPVTDPLGA